MNIKYKPVRQTILTALVDSAVKEQTEIGWKHFSGGRLSKKWQESLELHYGDRLKLDPTVKLTPCSSLIAKLWEMRLQLWRNRNEMKHGKTPEEQEKKFRARLDPKIRRVYAEQHQRMTPAARRQLFKVNLSRRLKFQGETNERWLEIVTTAKNAFERRAAYLLSRMTRLPKFYKVTRKRTRIENRISSKIEKFCRRQKRQETLSNFVLRWEAPPWGSGTEVRHVMLPVVEETDVERVTDKSEPTEKERT